jgi:type VI secretion system secreted protein Hcp
MNRTLPPCLLLSLALLAPAGAALANRETCSVAVPDANGNTSQIPLIGWSHEVVSPRDAGSGLPTGKRQHKPFTFIKTTDKATPVLYQAMAGDVTFPMVMMECRSAGKERHFYTVELENASIAGIRMEQMGERAENMRHEVREHVAFTYQKITHTWVSQDGSETSVGFEVDEAGDEQ